MNSVQLWSVFTNKTATRKIRSDFRYSNTFSPFSISKEEIFVSTWKEAEWFPNSCLKRRLRDGNIFRRYLPPHGGLWRSHTHRWSALEYQNYTSNPYICYRPPSFRLLLNASSSKVLTFEGNYPHVKGPNAETISPTSYLNPEPLNLCEYHGIEGAVFLNHKIHPVGQCLIYLFLPPVLAVIPTYQTKNIFWGNIIEIVNIPTY